MSKNSMDQKDNEIVNINIVYIQRQIIKRQKKIERAEWMEMNNTKMV